MEELKISVVIPCLNEEKHIEPCIRSRFDNRYIIDFLKVLVVQGMRIDGVLAILNPIKKELSKVKILRNPKIITLISLNIGLNNASFPNVLIASAHSSCYKNYNQTLMNVHIDNPDAYRCWRTNENIS